MAGGDSGSKADLRVTKSYNFLCVFCVCLVFCCLGVLFVCLGVFCFVVLFLVLLFVCLLSVTLGCKTEV